VSYVSIDLSDLLIASLLVLANGVLSLLFGLGLAKKLIWSALRMTIQLLAIGFVLRWLFAMESPWLTLIAALAMVAVAGREIMARQDRRLSGLWAYGLGTSTMLAAAMVVTVFALTTQIRPDPWWDPQYALPILGMILGNTMTGIALGLQTLTRGLERGTGQGSKRGWRLGKHALAQHGMFYVMPSPAR
jgi:putative ABC transport system permease protein